MIDSKQREGGLRRAISQPVRLTSIPLFKADVQIRISALQSQERKKAGAVLKNSCELRDLKQHLVDEWVRDIQAARTAPGGHSVFARSPLSKKNAIQVLDFAHRQLAPSDADDATTRAIKSGIRERRLLEQCLGLRALTMRPQEQGLLEQAFHLIAEAPFIEKEPEYAALKAAVDACPAEIVRVGNRMKLILSQAMQSVLGSDPSRLATKEPLRALGSVNYHLNESEIQLFIAGVSKLVSGQPLEENELAQTRQTAKRLHHHIPHAMLAEFENFVDLLNIYSAEIKT